MNVIIKTTVVWKYRETTETTWCKKSKREDQNIFQRFGSS